MSEYRKQCAAETYSDSRLKGRCWRESAIILNEDPEPWYCWQHDPKRKESKKASRERAALCVAACEGVPDDMLKRIRIKANNETDLGMTILEVHP